MLNRNHLALFRAVAEAGGFSRAAEIVRVGQPAISTQVAELEQALGLTLFDRLPRGVRLTAAGETLLSYAQRIATLELEAERAMGELRGLQRGRLALGASKSIGGYLLPAVLGEFRRRHPDVELQLTIANTETIQTRLVDGTLDLGFIEGAPPQNKHLEAHVFREDELVIIAPPGHPLTGGADGKRARPVTARQLCSHPFILREPGSGTREVLLRALKNDGVEPGEIVLTLTDTEAIKRAVMAGLGLAAVSRLCVGWELAAGRLAEVPVRALDLRRSLYRASLHNRRASPSVQAFTALMDMADRGDGHVKK